MLSARPCRASAKPGARTKSARLSRAYRGPARDSGTPELQRKKLAAVNGAVDPALSASPASILFAHGVLSRDQVAAAERYRRCYALSFGLPHFGGCLLSDGPSGRALDDDRLAHARRQLDAMVAALTTEQKLQIDNLVISAWIPGWFYAARGIGRALPTDERDRAALLTGLSALI